MATEVVERPAAVTPLSLIQLALEKGLDPDKLGRLMDLQERWQAKQAAERYADAIKAFQEEMPQIPKTRAVYNKEGGTVRYKFAAYEDVLKIAGPILAKNGITHSFSQNMTETDVIITVRVQVGSHFEDKPFVAPRPNFEAMGKPLGQSLPQAYGAVLSYFKRYAFCSALGITVCGEDSDAAAEGVGMQQGISEEQVRHLRALLRQKGRGDDEPAFLKYAGVETFDQITLGEFKAHVTMLSSLPETKKNGGGK